MAFIAFYVVMYSNMFYDVLQKSNLQLYIVPFFALLTSLILMFQVIRMAQGALFKSKDYDMLLAMPIKDSEILSSKMIYIILMNYFMTFSIMLTSTIFMVVKEGLPITYVLVGFILSLLIPVIPIIIGTLIAILIGYLSTKFKYTNAISNFFMMAITIVLVFFPSQLSSMTEMTFTKLQLDSLLKETYYPAYIFGQAINENNILAMIIYILGNIVLFALFTALLGKLYKKINQKMSEKYKAEKYDGKIGEAKPPIVSMYKKELRRLFGTSMYFLNTCMGMILIIFGAIASIFADDNTIVQMFSDGGEIGLMVEPLLIIVLSVITAMTCTTGSSISLEGKNIWIYKTMPVRLKDVFLSKILVNLTITIPSIILCALIFGFRFQITPYGYVLLTLIPITASVISSILGVLINLKFPKLDYDAEIYVIKKSVASMLSIFMPMTIVAFVLAITFGIFPNSYLIAFTGVLILFILISCILWVILNKWGKKAFAKLGN